ncbi:MAG TPA: hypothetical protein VFU07_06775 [Candidatus Lumbricidophila sp.]|nr:hypothetical protein [Candidatus Lumbricidophila sp.]
MPFRERRPSTFRRFDWGTRALGTPEPLPLGDVLIVDLVGLFHPEVLALLDVTIWCDIELSEASQRGMRRDLELGRDHNRLWHDVWIPNERDFAANFAPREHAQLLLK